MDWSGWASFGLIATAALTAVLVGAQLAGLTGEYVSSRRVTTLRRTASA